MTLLAHLNDTRAPLRYGAAAAYTLLATILLLQSSTNPLIGPAAPPGPPDLPREILLTLGHLGTFGGLVLVWTWALTAHVPVHRALWLIAPAAILYGGVTELIQGSVPDRTASIIDFAANVLGALTMAWFILRRTTNNIN